MKKMTFGAAALAGAAFAFSTLPSYATEDETPLPNDGATTQSAPSDVPLTTEQFQGKITESLTALQEKFKKVAIVTLTVSRDFYAFTNSDYPASDRSVMCSASESGYVFNNIKESAMGFSQAYQDLFALLKQGEVAMSQETAEKLTLMPKQAVSAVGASVQRANAIAGACQAMSQPPASHENEPQSKKHKAVPYSAQSIRFDI
jgi:hypothetical protein